MSRSGLAQRCLFAALHRYPLYSGGATLVQRRPFRRTAGDERVVLASLRDGGRIYVKPDDYIGRAILLTGDYDPKITWLCRKVLRPGDTMLDIGANVGVVTAYAARLVGNSGAVHAFEPQPELATLIARSAGLNEYSQVAVHDIGLSDRNERTQLRSTQPKNLGSASIHISSESARSIATVCVRSAKEVLASLGLGRIRMLKIDIEGHEGAVLRDAKEYIRGNPPDVIAFESQGRERFSRRPIVKILRGLGYELFQVPKALLAMRLVPIEGDAISRGFDFVGLQPSSGLAGALTRRARG